MPETDLYRLLAGIGKSTFVRYYDDLGNSNISDQDMIELLPKEYTLKSRQSRVYKSRRIFREGLEEDALTIIATSDNVDSDTLEKAHRLLVAIRGRRA